MDDKQEQERRGTLFEKHRENIYFRWGLTAFVVVVLCLIAAQFVTKLSVLFDAAGQLFHILIPVFYGLGIAYILDPIACRVQLFLQPKLETRPSLQGRAKGLSRGLGILAALLLLIFLIWALLAMILPQLLDSVNTIVRNLPVYYNTLRNWADRFISDMSVADYTDELMDTVYDYLSNWATTTLVPKLQDMVLSLTTSVVGMAKTLFNLIMGLIISIYLLMGKTRFLGQSKKIVYAVLGQKRGGYVCNLCTFANQAFGGFIGGKIVDSLIIGVICFIGMTLLKMPYALLISILVGVTNIIPFFGPYLGAIPSALLLLVVRPVYALTFIVFILILQQLDGNVIGPRILGNATGVSGIWVVISILVFGSFFGVLGMLIAVPTFAVIYKLVTEIVNRALKQRGLSTNTEEYSKWNYPPRQDPESWRRPRTGIFSSGSEQDLPEETDADPSEEERGGRDENFSDPEGKTENTG